MIWIFIVLFFIVLYFIVQNMMDSYRNTQFDFERGTKCECSLDCPLGWLCLEGTCVNFHTFGNNCKSNVDCKGMNKTCDVVSGSCVTVPEDYTCKGMMDCKSDESCLSGNCMKNNISRKKYIVEENLDDKFDYSISEKISRSNYYKKSQL